MLSEGERRERKKRPHFHLKKKGRPRKGKLEVSKTISYSRCLDETGQSLLHKRREESHLEEKKGGRRE